MRDEEVIARASRRKKAIQILVLVVLVVAAIKLGATYWWVQTH